jgi:hypothetical protein
MERSVRHLAEAPSFAEAASPTGPPERRIDYVPEYSLPNAYRLIGIDQDPLEVARRCGAESAEVATLCRRGHLRVAMPPLDECAIEAVRRLWDTLETVDSKVVRERPDHDRENYFRDQTAWEAVFFEHVRRQVGGNSQFAAV